MTFLPFIPVFYIMQKCCYFFLKVTTLAPVFINNNISRSRDPLLCNPRRPPVQNLGVATPKPQDWRLRLTLGNYDFHISHWRYSAIINNIWRCDGLYVARKAIDSNPFVAKFSVYILLKITQRTVRSSRCLIYFVDVGNRENVDQVLRLLQVSVWDQQ